MLLELVNMALFNRRSVMISNIERSKIAKSNLEPYVSFLWSVYPCREYMLSLKNARDNFTHTSPKRVCYEFFFCYLNAESRVFSSSKHVTESPKLCNQKYVKYLGNETERSWSSACNQQGIEGLERITAGYLFYIQGALTVDVKLGPGDRYNN